MINFKVDLQYYLVAGYLFNDSLRWRQWTHTTKSRDECQDIYVIDIKFFIVFVKSNRSVEDEHSLSQRRKKQNRVSNITHRSNWLKIVRIYHVLQEHEDDIRHSKDVYPLANIDDERETNWASIV